MRPPSLRGLGKVMSYICMRPPSFQAWWHILPLGTRLKADSIAGCTQTMDPWKCTLSGGANSLSMAPSSILNKVNEEAQPEKEERDTGHVVEAGADMDIREVYFLIMHFLSVGPCQRTFEQFGNDLLEHQVLPRRYHAWFSRSGVGSGNNNDVPSLSH
ncbi:hypothetical protein CerSpe_297740 [Prunus speciosa]